MDNIRYDHTLLMKEIAEFINSNNINTFEIIGYKHLGATLRINWTDAHQLIKFKWSELGMKIEHEIGEMIQHEQLPEVIRFKKNRDELDPSF